MKTWKEIRRDRVWLIWMLLLLAAGVVAALSAAFLAWIYGATSGIETPWAAVRRSVALFLTNRLKYAEVIVGKETLPNLVVNSPFFAIFLTTFFFLLWPTKKVAERLHDLFFAAFNHDVLRPIKSPPAWDPLRGSIDEVGGGAMPWVLPSDGPRRATWDALQAFIGGRAAGTGRGSFIPGREGDRFIKVSWAVLTGEAGAGKSRMAVELARQRARRDILGGEGQSWRDRSRLRWGAWWRATWPPLERRESDPWDAGWLAVVDGPGAVTWTTRRRVEEGWLARLREWRPRYPTVLLLDDPLPNDSAAVIGALLAAAGKYRFPVRLLIVSQTVPTELDLSREPQPGQALQWVTGTPGFSGTVVNLGADERLSESDVRVLATALHLPARLWRNSTAQVRQFLQITRGNALLAELGFDWLRQGRPLDGMTRAALLQERAGRIVAALRAAGLGTDPHLHVLAVATLAGGTGDLSEQVRRDRVLAVFGQPTFDRKIVGRVFSLARSDVEHLPPIRPELLGDGFVRYVLAEMPDDPTLAERIVRAAWTANPRGTLRATRRLLRADDALARAIAAGPPEVTGEHRVEFALAFTEAAVQIPIEEWEIREFDNGATLLASALRYLGEVPPEAAAACLERITAIMTPSAAIVRGRAGLQSFATVAERALLDPAWPGPDQVAAAIRALTSVCQQAKRWGLDEALMSQQHQEALAGFAGRFASISNPCADNAADGWPLLIRTLSFGAYRLRRTAAALLEATCVSHIRNGHRSVITSNEEALCRRLAARARSYRLAEMPVQAAETPDASFSELASIGDGCRTVIELERVRSWGHFLNGYSNCGDLAGAHSAADRVEAIALPAFAGERDFELERARAWRGVTHAAASTRDMAGAHSAADRVEAITSPAFAGERDFELERVVAWRGVAHAAASTSDAAGARSAADRVEAIALPAFAGERDFELERARAWRSVALACANASNVAGARSAADRVEAIALPAFAGERDFELERAGAWHDVAHACASTSDAAGARSAADRVEAITLPAFAGERDSELERAGVWRSVALACANASNVAGARSAADRVEAIALPAFAGERGFELERVMAWRNVAHACARVGDEAGVRSAADHVRAIVLPAFASDPEMMRFVE